LSIGVAAYAQRPPRLRDPFDNGAIDIPPTIIPDRTIGAPQNLQ